MTAAPGGLSYFYRALTGSRYEPLDGSATPHSRLGPQGSHSCQTRFFYASCQPAFLVTAKPQGSATASGSMSGERGIFCTLQATLPASGRQCPGTQAHSRTQNPHSIQEWMGAASFLVSSSSLPSHPLSAEICEKPPEGL